MKICLKCTDSQAFQDVDESLSNWNDSRPSINIFWSEKLHIMVF